MADMEKPPATAATMSSQNTTESVEKVIAKPEEAHERSNSLSSLDTGNVDLEKDLEKQPEVDGTIPAQRVQSSTESIYRGKAETAAIMLALVLAIFLLALVCRSLTTFANYSVYLFRAKQYLGSNDHCNSHPQDDR